MNKQSASNYNHSDGNGKHATTTAGTAKSSGDNEGGQRGREPGAPCIFFFHFSVLTCFNLGDHIPCIQPHARRTTTTPTRSITTTTTHPAYTMTHTARRDHHDHDNHTLRATFRPPPPSLASKRETEGLYIPPPSHAPSNRPQMPPPASHYPPLPPNARRRVRTSPHHPMHPATDHHLTTTALPRFQTRDGGFVHPPTIPCI